MNLDPSDVALLERGQHVQDRVEAAPPVESNIMSGEEFTSPEAQKELNSKRVWMRTTASK
ncbi:hypothetical protein EYF80_021417 [Liparis tanakae]|uniref:Uncharacterized protein n=1 Tax=Liparis tanakae TaxID=230148 RepID=A0A4Z2HTQ3_9TELE|nr:hypothetical protein EYF80_021417 [Liparis tanakae]